MSKLTTRIGLAVIAALAIAMAGCIVSGTFIIDETFKMTEAEHFYSYRLDLTTDPTWDEHKDDIQIIEAVGFVLYLDSSEDDDVYLSAYIDRLIGAAPNPTEVPTTATVVIDSLVVAPGKQVIPYARSLGFITNLDYLKELAMTGRFDFYATSTGSDGETFKIDSVTVIVTLGAG